MPCLFWWVRRIAVNRMVAICGLSVCRWLPPPQRYFHALPFAYKHPPHKHAIDSQERRTMEEPNETVTISELLNQAHDSVEELRLVIARYDWGVRFPLRVQIILVTDQFRVHISSAKPCASRNSRRSTRPRCATFEQSLQLSIACRRRLEYSWRTSC